ncbi:MAG: LuxR C-terminal-related transcriptional regulator [Oscillospiraceae bacterium]|nr:LuxR C-terminal-related transcriptional regulator [Oscillospiraceae bacterium]
MNKPGKAGFYNSNLASNYMQRPRLNNILDDAASCKLVYVIASAGYGKTQAVHHYIEQQQNAAVWWMQLTERDNIGSRYWERLVHIISNHNPELAAKMHEFGFPETPSRFKRFIEVARGVQYSSKKIFIVFDDFHLVHSKEVTTFTERLVHLKLPGVCIVILSRKEPEINVVSLFSKGDIRIITEDELCFTTAEAAEFFIQCAIPLSAQSLSQLMDTTKGWALAINMLSLILKRTPSSLKHALDAMMQNIFKFLEIEAWDDFQKKVQKDIVKLSLLSDLPIALPQEFSDKTEFLRVTPELASFVWFCSFTNDLRIHPLYLEFLQSKHNILLDEEKKELYGKAARWCSKNDFYMDAVRYYAKLNQFDCVIKVLLSYPFKLPRDASEYLLSILENLDSDNKEQLNPGALFLKNYFTPLLLVGAGRYEEAQDWALAVVREWERVDTPLSIVFLYTSYSNLSYIDMYTCTVTHEYSSPEYLRKSVEYFKRSTIPPAETAGAFINGEIRSFACLVGEGAALSNFEQFLEASRESALYTEQTPFNIFVGYDDLVACEYAFFKNQPDIAKNHAHKAILKAREKKQYSISIMAEKYLLCTAVQEGNAALAKEVLRQMRFYLDNPDFRSRQMYYDLYTGLFYAQIGLPEMVPLWLVTDDRDTASEIHMPSGELIASAWHNVASKKYHQALVILCNSYPREKQERFLFGELSVLLLTAVARIRTGDTAGAIADFEKAYKMSFQGVFEMFFIELGKELHPLIAAALNHEDCSIPEKWLAIVYRKTSIYAKKAAVVANTFKNKKLVKLSNRELEVLNDLYHGLSREEIATNRHMSINTVKKTLQSIYIKLDAHNNVDAVRIALEKKLIE